MTRTPMLIALTDELERAGITHHRVEYGGKHPRLVFDVAGRVRSYTFPGTCWDGPSRHAVVAELRRMLRELQQLPPPRRKAPRHAGRVRVRIIRPRFARIPVLEFVPPRDPWAPLIPLLARLQVGGLEG
jgi:hypothetical protein